MSNLKFNGGQTLVVPAIATDKGYILWSLLRHGPQTVEELQHSTDIRGVSARVHDLNDPITIIYTTAETKNRVKGTAIKKVDIVRYHVNLKLVDLSLRIWKDFLIAGDALYS